MAVKEKLKGIYAITPEKFDEDKLFADISTCLSGGITCLLYTSPSPRDS